MNQRKTESRGKPQSSDGNSSKPTNQRSRNSQSKSNNAGPGAKKTSAQGANPNSKSKSSNRNRNRKRKPKSGAKAKKTGSGEHPLSQPAEDYSKHTPTTPKKYQVKFFDNFNDARKDPDSLLALCSDCDQLNVVVRAEGNMEDPEIIGIDPKIKLFAGEAWALIHDRRVEDHWYDQPQ